MNSSALSGTQLPAQALTKPRFAGAIWTLVALSPFIGEILSGSTRTSILFVFIPEMMVWGVGALLCRELVRPMACRRRQPAAARACGICG